MGSDSVLGFLPWYQKFSLIFLRMRELRESPQCGENENPLVTLDLNLTFMQTEGRDLTLGLGLVDIFTNTQISMTLYQGNIICLQNASVNSQFYKRSRFACV